MVAAPIVAGGVHRRSMIALMAAAVLGLSAMAAGLTWQRQTLRVGLAVILPLVFVVIPLLQSIPLPMNVRAILDRNGTALLRDNQLLATATWPLSLDPPSTQVDVGRAAAGLMAFLVAYHLASGQSRRHLVLRALGIAGIAGVAIGAGHRIFGAAKLYGLFASTPRALLAGPFVNPNHTAEFLELSAFLCLACSFQRPTALNRVGWFVGTVLCAAGAAATLSRGAALALTSATLLFFFLRYFGTDAPGPSSRRAKVAWAVFLVGLVFLGAAALGAGQLIDRFKADGVTSDLRLRLWRQGLQVFAAHPFGIGRGAFDRVFPIYRAIRMPFPLRFAFLENEPLQLLIDCGWLFYSILVGCFVVVAYQIVRRGRRDKLEAALLAGLFAIFVHNVVDFGLETLGILLPTMAVLGVVLGRLRPADQPTSKWRLRFARPWLFTGVATLGLAFGVVSTARGSNDDFDSMLKKNMSVAARRDLLLRAQQAHPLDYFYPLSDAPLEPIRGAPGTPSPRLHALNRALRLCPGCQTVHLEVARNFWRLGFRPQALLEWRTVIDLEPRLFGPTVGELFSLGAKPEELVAVSAQDPDRLLQLVDFLSARGRFPDALVALDQADALGVPRGPSLLERARIQMLTGQTKMAAATMNAARQISFQDPRLAVLEAQLLVQTQGALGADQALSVLDSATSRYPTDLGVQTERIGIVTQFKKWNAAARALDGYKQALYVASGSATDAHVAGARIESELGHWTTALGEYRMALADRPNDVQLWTEFARAADASGHDATAREAFDEAARLSPNSRDIINAQKDASSRAARWRALTEKQAGGGAQESAWPGSMR